MEKDVIITQDQLILKGILALPHDCKGIIVFAHGSGSGRLSPRNQYVAKQLQKDQFGTFLLDLLSEEEENIDNRKNVFDIDLLAKRLNLAKNWILQNVKTHHPIRIGFFGASTGAGAAIAAVANDPSQVFAVVSRGGRPDLAKAALSNIAIPTLLIVGGDDGIVINLNQEAFDQMQCTKKLHIIPGATHLFEEPGTLEEVARLATEWFSKYYTLRE